MGVFSEMDAKQRYGSNPFAEDIVPSAFTEQETLAWSKPAATPPAFEDEDCQQAEADAAPAVLAQLNQAQDSEPDIPQDSGETPTAASETKESADEDANRQAHEAAEAQRKAEWEAQQAKKKASIQEQIDRLAAMNDDDVMMSSMKRVSADTEKITRRNMKDCVSEYIQTKCLEDPDFARWVMHPRKSMVHCFQYINRKAFEYVQDELKANGIQPSPGQQMYASDVPDDLCYQWAVDYFNDPDAKEDQVKEEKFVPKPYAGKSSASKGKAKKRRRKRKPRRTRPQSQNRRRMMGSLAYWRQRHERYRQKGLPKVP